MYPKCLEEKFELFAISQKLRKNEEPFITELIKELLQTEMVTTLEYLRKGLTKIFVNEDCLPKYFFNQMELSSNIHISIKND